MEFVVTSKHDEATKAWAKWKQYLNSSIFPHLQTSLHSYSMTAVRQRRDQISGSTTVNGLEEDKELAWRRVVECFGFITSKWRIEWSYVFVVHIITWQISHMESCFTVTMTGIQVSRSLMDVIISDDPRCVLSDIPRFNQGSVRNGRIPKDWTKLSVIPIELLFICVQCQFNKLT